MKIFKVYSPQIKEIHYKCNKKVLKKVKILKIFNNNHGVLV